MEPGSLQVPVAFLCWDWNLERRADTIVYRVWGVMSPVDRARKKVPERPCPFKDVADVQQIPLRAERLQVPIGLGCCVAWGTGGGG